jgi:hypothetical protein
MKQTPTQYQVGSPRSLRMAQSWWVKLFQPHKTISGLEQKAVRVRTTNVATKDSEDLGFTFVRHCSTATLSPFGLN